MAKLIKIFLPLVSGICTIIAAISAFRTNGVAVTVLTVFTGFISIWTAVSPFLDSLSIYRIVQEVIRYVQCCLCKVNVSTLADLLSTHQARTPFIQNDQSYFE
ncbi:hypothetical protein MPER_07755 [Moniliophthora perniciosa FA553]|nr:hypothetical protein MPER_07755 [Moniliophthora perniciosa FA553]